MKIALLHYSSPPVVGGVESVLAHHACLMADAGHHVVILTGNGKQLDERIDVHILKQLSSRHIEVVRVKKLLDNGEYTSDFDALCTEIYDLLISELNGFDFLIAHNVASLHKNLPLTAALNQVYRILDPLQLILWHHDLAWTTERYSQEMHAGYPWNLLRARWDGAIHVVVSELRRQELSQLTGIPREVIRVIPNGVDPNIFYKLEPKTILLMKQLNLSDADPLFLLPVRLTPRKNIELALHILTELRSEYPKAALLVTGPEGPHNPANALYKQKLLDLRSKLHLEGAVHFLAEATPELLPDSVIADFYRLADAVLFTSREEGFGIPLIEAAFSAKPVFCADIPVLRELGGDDVSYFDLDMEPHSIATQICKRLESEATIRWSRHAKRRYSWNSIYRSYIELLLEDGKR